MEVWDWVRGWGVDEFGGIPGFGYAGSVYGGSVCIVGVGLEGLSLECRGTVS
jgi:hypothetical protein